eukprot:3263145-Prymnesium_polylepis.1
MEMSGRVMATSFGMHLELSRMQVAKSCRTDGAVRQMLGLEPPDAQPEPKPGFGRAKCSNGCGRWAFEAGRCR